MDLELEARDAEPVAILAALTANVNRGKNSKAYAPADFNPASRQLFALEARELVGQKAARIFLDLLGDEKVPGWVPGLVDMEIIKAAAQ